MDKNSYEYNTYTLYFVTFDLTLGCISLRTVSSATRKCINSNFSWVHVLVFSKTSYEIFFFSRNDVHQISRERNQHIEAFQDVDRDNVSLREELKKYNTKLEKLFKYKVSF